MVEIYHVEVSAELSNSSPENIGTFNHVIPSSLHRYPLQNITFLSYCSTNGNEPTCSFPWLKIGAFGSCPKLRRPQKEASGDNLAANAFRNFLHTVINKLHNGLFMTILARFCSYQRPSDSLKKSYS